MPTNPVDNRPMRVVFPKEKLLALGDYQQDSLA